MKGSNSVGHEWTSVASNSLQFQWSKPHSFIHRRRRRCWKGGADSTWGEGAESQKIEPPCRPAAGIWCCRESVRSAERDFHNGLIQNVKIATGGLHWGIIPISQAILLPAPPNIYTGRNIWENRKKYSARQHIKENVELAVNKSRGSQ
jgi:hypothetical protein